MWHPGGSSHPNWKGDAVGYGGLHRWVTKNLGRPQFCEECKKTSVPKNTKEYGKIRYFQWANISGKYKRELSDWKRLCIPCHGKFDGKSNRMLEIWKHREKAKSITIICKLCGKERVIREHRLKQKGRGQFCGLECSRKARVLYKYGKIRDSKPIQRKD